MKHIKLLLLLVAIATVAVIQNSQAEIGVGAGIDSCRTELRWDADDNEYQITCTGGCESSTFEVVIFDDPVLGSITIDVEAANCETKELTNHAGTYTTCTCQGTDGSGETPCCHLVQLDNDDFTVIGDCVSCPLTGVCQLYSGPNGNSPQSYCGPPPVGGGPGGENNTNDL